MIDKVRMYDNMKRVVGVPGVSGTPAEKETAYKIQELLLEIPYFQQHREKVKLVPVADDSLGRSIVTAYLQCCPESRKTVILTGHYDVVDVEEYGNLKGIAYNTEEITRRIGELPLDEDSLRDLESGEWIFGRGTADMKFGHALCLELLRYFSEEGRETLCGNLLYAAVCGEETNSEGMLQAVPFFNQFAEETGAEYEALLLTECYMPEDQAGDSRRYVHMGASGKVMPMFFCAGEASHGGEPFLGIDPNLIAARIYEKLHMNVDFCQSSCGEVTPPPVCLKSQDLKTVYSVSTPLYAVSYYNLVTVDLEPEALMESLCRIAEESFKEALGFIEEKSRVYEKRFGVRPARCSIEPSVKSFRQLYREAEAAFEGDLSGYLKALTEEWRSENTELQDIAVRLVKRLYELSPDKRPAVIVSIIPPYYPDVYPDRKSEKGSRLARCVDEIIAYAEETYGETLEWKDYYMGISDLSYTGLDEDKDFSGLFENVAGAGLIYSLPEADLKKFYVPAIVLGGSGKDFHKYTERLERRYNFDILPDLYIRLIEKLLG